jgi:hypothetical protein
MEGESITFNSKIYNVSSVPAENVTVELSTDASGLNTVLQSQKIAPIPPYDSAAFSYIYSSKGQRGNHAFVFKIDPLDSLVEQTKDNNSVALSFAVQADTVRPVLQIAFDGIQINNGDYVRKQPVISIHYSDNNPSLITSADTSSFVIHLNNERVYFIPGIAELLPTASPGEARINWTPNLPNGESTIQIYAKDVSGNSSDTVVLLVNVSAEFILSSVYNYPNPFLRATDFTFNILAPMNPDEVTIKIFTIAGRLIQEIKTSGKIGFNKIGWDGRDKDGDEVANGVYFYKIIATTNGVTKEAIQKLAKVR